MQKVRLTSRQHSAKVAPAWRRVDWSARQRVALRRQQMRGGRMLAQRVRWFNLAAAGLGVAQAAGLSGVSGALLGVLVALGNIGVLLASR